MHAGVAYISGQSPLDASGAALTDQPFDVQVAQVLDNLDDCLRTAGSSRAQLLSVILYATDITQWPAFDAACAQGSASAAPPRRLQAWRACTMGPRSRSWPSRRAMSGAADIVVLATGGTIDKVYHLAGELEIGSAAI